MKFLYELIKTNIPEHLKEVMNLIDTEKSVVK